MDLIYTLQKIRQLTILAADAPIREWNNHYCVLLTVEGKGELHINEHAIMLQPGTVTFCNADCYFDLHSAKNYDLVVYIVTFEIYKRTLLSGEHDPVYTRFTQPWQAEGEIYVQSYYRLHDLVKELYAIYESNDKPYMQQILLYELLQLLDEEQTQPTSLQSEHNQSIQQVMDYLHQNYNNKITREDMAQFAGFHPHVFSKIFKEETGYSFSEYLAHIRIRKAKEQLILTDNNLNDIALSVGYANGLYLSRKFKLYTGISPSTYIQQPKRIVIYDWVGNLLALGIKPVGASYFYGLENMHLLQDQLQGIVDVGRNNIENVIALNPELIIVPKWLGTSIIHKLEKIAPTIVVPYGNAFERFRQLALTLRKSDEADQFITRYVEKAANVHADIADIIQSHETVGLYELSPSHNIWVFNEFHGRSGYNLFRGLGLTPPASIAQDVIGKGQLLELTLDQLPNYAADHMFISYPFHEQSKQYVTEIMQHPIWQQLPAYLHNRIYFIDRNLYHPNDVYSLYLQLDLLKSLIRRHGRTENQPCIFVHEIGDI